MHARTALVLSLALAACARTPRYDLWATGYTGGAPATIAPGTTVALVPNPAAANPLLERELLGQLRQALVTAGYPEAPLDQARVAVFVDYGTGDHAETRATMNFVPPVSTTVTDSAGKTIGTATTAASIQWVPETTTRTDRWLTISAVGAPALRASGEKRWLWIGEVKSFGQNLDLRRTLGYMVVPAARIFGTNADQTRVRLTEDDVMRVANSH